MNREPKNHHEGDAKGGGGRGLGGPPLGVKYGGMAQQVYVPPSQRGAAPSSTSAKAAPKSSAPAEAKAPAKKMAASRSRYGSIAPMKPLAKAPIFESTLTLNLVDEGATGSWPKYVSDKKVSDSKDGVVNGVYIHRDALPSPLPKKIKVKFEPA